MPCLLSVYVYHVGAAPKMIFSSAGTGGHPHLVTSLLRARYLRLGQRCAARQQHPRRHDWLALPRVNENLVAYANRIQQIARLHGAPPEAGLRAVRGGEGHGKGLACSNFVPHRSCARTRSTPPSRKHANGPLPHSPVPLVALPRTSIQVTSPDRTERRGELTLMPMSGCWG
jgi:hypothetical protein